MLDDHHGIAPVPEFLQGPQQPGIIPVVQADGGFVENVEHPYQAAADLAGQADPLGLAARQGRCRAIQCKVMQPHVHQEAEASADLFEGIFGNENLFGLQIQAVKEFLGQADGHGGEIRYGSIPNPNGQRFGLKAPPVAVRADHIAHQILELLPEARSTSPAIPFHFKGHDPLPPAGVAVFPLGAGVAEFEASFAGTVEEHLALPLGEVLKRCV